jgi:IstB-like ATP binding protein
VKQADLAVGDVGLGALGGRPEILTVDEVLATAILDLLLHKSHVLDIKGRSYRLRDLQHALQRAL